MHCTHLKLLHVRNKAVWIKTMSELKSATFIKPFLEEDKILYRPVLSFMEIKIKLRVFHERCMHETITLSEQ